MTAETKKKKRPAAKKPVARKTPVRAPKAPPARPGPRILALVVQALDAKKAGDIRVLEVGNLSSITDYLVLATATSDPHQRALRVELEKVLDAKKAKIVGIETSRESGWTVVDAFDVMIHLFTAENRDRYRLDLLWRDAVEVPIDSLLKA